MLYDIARAQTKHDKAVERLRDQYKREDDPVKKATIKEKISKEDMTLEKLKTAKGAGHIVKGAAKGAVAGLAVAGAVKGGAAYLTHRAVAKGV